jgi:transcriptional regulator with PAS, ATPase and Fis domain
MRLRKSFTGSGRRFERVISSWRVRSNYMLFSLFHAAHKGDADNDCNLWDAYSSHHGTGLAPSLAANVPLVERMERASPAPPLLDDEPALGVFSSAMRGLVDLARRVARVDSSILITGESGVGKECLAQFIHRASARAVGPFIPVNCGALSETLAESELFGHVRGAFTGAFQDRPGLFEAANGGTLLLDEVGDVPLPMQVKLLRVIQEREVRRLGENRQRHVDVRLIAATNRNLQQAVDEGRFRVDLYFRLNVVELHVPPLRERPDDLRGLAAMLQTRIATRMHRAIGGYTDAALNCLLQYAWPGNIRELENAIERACALATGLLIDVDDLPNTLRTCPSVVAASQGVRPLYDVEREYILDVLQRNGGNKVHTAEQLRINTTTLFRKLKRYAKAN